MLGGWEFQLPFVIRQSAEMDFPCMGIFQTVQSLTRTPPNNPPVTPPFQSSHSPHAAALQGFHCRPDGYVLRFRFRCFQYAVSPSQSKTPLFLVVNLPLGHTEPQRPQSQRCLSQTSKCEEPEILDLNPITL